MRIGLAQARFPTSVAAGVAIVQRFLREARAAGRQIICLPEAFLPGMRGCGFEVPGFSPAEQQQAVEAVAATARETGVAVVLPMEWQGESGVLNVATVIDGQGQVLGYQPKVQLDPAEDRLFVPGQGRRLFTIGGLTFGVAICHEGWRYPETVRWAAMRGAGLVFHPHICGGPEASQGVKAWGQAGNPYYDGAQVCRSVENNIYFASVNYALDGQESATCLISPAGACVAWAPYGEETLLVCEIDPAAATGLLARRYSPGRYGE
jgi:predicted amidohydrolase